MDTLANPAATYHVRRVSGADAIQRELPALASAACAWGQAELVQEVPYHVSVLGRFPLLLLLSDGPADAVRGAVLLYAYGHALFGARLLATADRYGRMGVFGPAAQRPNLAIAAMRALLEAGAGVVRVNLALPEGESPELWENEWPSLQHETFGEWTFRSRELFYDLTLHAYPDETLAQLGRRTRRNIRYAMRTSAADLRCTFVAEAPVTIDDLLAMNQRSEQPLPRAVLAWRMQQANKPNAFLAGLRAADGRWICLAAGCLTGSTVVLHWQSNDLGFASYSPSLLMRGHLLQHFSEQGMRSLFFEGGTSHLLTKHFNKRAVYFLQARRQTLWVGALQAVLQRCLPRKAITRIIFGFG